MDFAEEDFGALGLGEDCEDARRSSPFDSCEPSEPLEEAASLSMSSAAFCRWGSRAKKIFFKNSSMRTIMH